MSRHSRLLTPVVALALAGGLTVAVPPATSAAPVQDKGVTLPPLWRTTPPWNPLWGGTPGYVLHNDTPHGEGVPYSMGITRLSDGKELGPFAESSLSSGTSLVGSSYLVELNAPGSGTVTDIEATNLETGEVSSTTVPAGDEVVRADESWTLVRVGTGSGYALRLLRPGGTNTLVDGPGITWNAKYVGGDADTAYLKDNTDVYRVDVAANTVSLLPRPADGWDRVVVGPHRLFDVRGTSDAAGAPVQQITWWSRDGQETGQAQVPTAADSYDLWLPYGDRLLFVPQDVQTPTGPVSPVDLAGNTLEAPLATDVVDAEPLGDGRVVLVRSDHPAGSLSIAADDGAGLGYVTDMPRVPQIFHRLRLAGDVLRGYADDNTSVATASDGSGSWQPAPVPYAESGDVTLTDTGTASPDAGDHYDVSWPRGSRQITDVGPRLGHDGDLLAVTRSYDVDAPTEVQDTRTGAVVSVLPEVESFALDGSWVWSLTPAGDLTGHDATGTEPDVHLSTGLATSGERLLDVRGRFALVSSGYRSYVVDTHEVVPTWQVPAGKAQLGGGFVAGVNVVRPSTGTRSVTLEVFDLTPEHTEHDYPGLQGLFRDQDISFSVDEAGTPRVAYVDVYGQPWQADLGWLGTPPPTAPDTLAPVLTSAPSQPALVRSSVAKTFTWSWSFADSGRRYSPASGIASYDVRWRDETGSSAPATPWTQPAAWQRMSQASVTRTLVPGAGGCVSARAHDDAGNISSWSAPACTFVDGAAPVPLPMPAAPRVARQLNDTVILPFHATDDDKVASYDVAYRVATLGQASYGPWQTASSQTSPFTTDPRPGSDWCVRFRGRDVAGRVGAWSAPHCQAVPVSAGAFHSPGDSLLIVNRRAIGGVYLQLNYPGARATLSRQGGRAVALCVLRGPGQGVADVYFGSRRLARIHFKAATDRQAVITLPLPARAVGTVRVVEVGRRPVRIDGLAMLR